MGDFLKFDESVCSTNISNAGTIMSNISSTASNITTFCSSHEVPYSVAYKADTYSWDPVTKTSVCNNDGFDYRAQRNNFNGALDSASTSASGLQAAVIDLIKAYQDALTTVQSSVDAFEGSFASGEISLAKAMGFDDTGVKVLEDGTYFEYSTEDTDGDGIADNEVVYYVYTDENGVEVKATIAEMVNAFYTYTGMTMSAMVSAGVTNGEALTPEQQNEILGGVNSFVSGALGAHAFGMASENDINEYRDAVGNYVDWSANATYWDSLKKDADEKGINALLPGISSVAVGALGAYTLTDSFKEKYKEDEKTGDGLLKAVDKEEIEKLSDGLEEPDELLDDPSTILGTDPGTGPGTGPGTSPGTGPGTSPSPSPSPSPDDGGDGGSSSSPSVEIVETVDTKVPEVQEVEVTPQDIDEMARDAFYEKYSEDGALAERRTEDINSFDQLFNNEDKTELVSKFEEMGYDPSEALAAANNKEVGLSAFMLGSQNSETAEIANNLAKELGLEQDFDTVYDDKPDYGDLFDGDAAVSLTDPNSNDAIVKAKEVVDEAKETYTESVTAANKSIETASVAKTELETVKKEIVKVAGTDTSKWSKEQIEKYNDAAEKYNTAVTKANDAVVESEKAKQAYTNAKETLQKETETFYDEIRKQATQELGNDVLDESTAGTNINTPGEVETPQTSEEIDQSLLDMFVDSNTDNTL